MIPKIFHWVWITSNPLPEKDRAWMQSWHRYHPEWRCVVWAEFPENITMDGFEVRLLPPLVNQWSIENIGRWMTERETVAGRSDIIRYEVILEGGVYLDTDVECFANIEPRLEGVSLFVADEWGPSQGHQGNFMFGAAPNHPAFYSVVRDLEHHLRTSANLRGVLHATGPFYLHSKLWRYAQELVVFPFKLFSPLNYWHDPEQVEVWPAVSLGNHHCDGKWFDREKTTPPQEFLKESQ